jgi:glycosyltransferase involved in cell wall biosynthesis
MRGRQSIGSLRLGKIVSDSIMSTPATIATKAPKVSVCIPTYAGAGHLAATIDSVLAQTFPDFELLIIDDRSIDSTVEIVKRYQDPRIRLLVNESKLGAEGNWNRCREEARGDYFKLLPQDDLIAPDCLARQAAALDMDNDARISIAFGASQVIDANGRVLMRRSNFGGVKRSIAADDVILKCVRRGSNLIGEPGNVLLRRSLMDRIGPFDARNPYLIDLDYWFRALRCGAAYYDPATLSSFRISAGSWSVAIGTGQYSDVKKFLRRYATDPRFHFTKTDERIGLGMAWTKARLRMILYRRLPASRTTP